jgi:predicted glycoside hydrolase/deacetylase ChbG (UPF0249 family)
VLCADDYGLTPSIGAGIRELLSMGRLSATSCVVISSFWKAESRLLRDLASSADIGLHVALTHLTPIAPMPHLAPAGDLPSPSTLLIRAHFGQLDANEISEEINRQIDTFSQTMGRPPDYIDGHHHVHQFPVVRDALLKNFQLRLPSGTAIRISYEPLSAIWWRGIARVRAAIISTSARSLRRAVNKAGIHCNKRFSGVRDFREAAPYRNLFRRFLMDNFQNAPEGLAVMCHPGRADSSASSEHAIDARLTELGYLLGNEFAADLEMAAMRLCRFRDLPRGTRGDKGHALPVKPQI